MADPGSSLSPDTSDLHATNTPRQTPKYTVLKEPSPSFSLNSISSVSILIGAFESWLFSKFGKVA